MLRDAAISLSLANLCFVKVWGKALSGAGAYFSEFKIAYAALVLDVLLLALVFFCGITVVRKLIKSLAWRGFAQKVEEKGSQRQIDSREGDPVPALRLFFSFIELSHNSGGDRGSLSDLQISDQATLILDFLCKAVWRLATWSFLIAVLTSLNGIAVLILTLSGVNFSTMLGRSSAYALGICAISLLIAASVLLRRKVSQLAPRLLLILLPFVVITFSQAAFKLVQNVGVVSAAGARAARVGVPHKTPASRVAWIVFDELDQRLAFDQRPANINLPELDRFLSESVHASNAYPPAPLTYMSMPALITGRLVSRVTPVRADELMVKFDGEAEDVAWSGQPNVFSKARAAGYNTGLAGWCHPYCEVIGNSLSQCEEVKEKTNDDISLGASMFSQAEGLISTVPLVQQMAIPIVQRVGFVNEIVTKTERRKYTVRYKHVLESAVKSAVDPNLDLIFVHSPAPHPPGIYDSAKDELSLESHNSYVDNLELVDRTVGELRHAMENAGLWDNTTIIITADHWWRFEMWSRGPFWTPNDAKVAGDVMDHRIPFLVKLAGQHDKVNYQTGFNTVLTHDLVLAIMNGQIANSNDLVNWLDRNRTISDSPYNRDELLP